MRNYSLGKKWAQTGLFQLAKVLHKHAVAVCLIFFSLTVYMGFIAVNTPRETSLRDLLPEHNLVVRRFEEAVDNFGLVDRVMVVLEFEPQQASRAELFAEILVDLIKEDPQYGDYLQWVRANLFSNTGITEWRSYLSYVARFVPEEKLPDLIRRLSPEGIREAVHQNRLDLEGGLGVKSLIRNDPLRLLDLAASYKNEITGNYKLDLGNGFMISQDHRMMLIAAKPAKSQNEIAFAVALTDYLNQKIEQAKVAFEEEEDIRADQIFKLGITGAHAIAAREDATIRKDLINMFVSSFAMVLLLFVIAYHRPVALFYVGVPLICAGIWTLGATYLLFGKLNLLTAAFSAVIVGLGIDYAIHIFSRYRDEANDGASPLVAMQRSLSETGLGTLVGGITTALAFYAMGFTDFSGMREFAISAGTGILICLMLMFVLLPSMVFVREKWRHPNKPLPKPQWDFFAEGMVMICLRHKKLVVLIIVLFTIFMAERATDLHFNSDLRSIRARSNPAIELQSRVTEKVGGSLRSLSLVLEADTEADLYKMHRQIQPEFQALRKEGQLVRYDHILSVIPDPDHQARNLEGLRQAGISATSLAENFRQAMTDQNFVLNQDAEDYIHHLGLGLDATGPITIEALLQAHPELFGHFVKKIDGKFKALSHIYPSKGLWEKNATRQVTNRILSAVQPPPGAGIFPTGIQTISDEIKALTRTAFFQTTIIAVVMVLAALWFHFRKLVLVLLTLLPLVSSTLWMLGTMRLLGIDINILNFVATPIIIGIGIDDGVHIVEKYLCRADKDLSKVIASCAKAVTLTSLTTILGFSSLFLATYSGFRSLGLCAILGVFYCWLGAVLVLPILMEFFGIKFKRELMITEGEDNAA